MNRQRRRRGGGGGQGNQNQGQQGRGRGQGGGSIPWNRLSDPQIESILARQQRIEDEDRAAAVADKAAADAKEIREKSEEKAEATAKEAKDKASKAAEAAKQNIVTVNAAVSTILGEMTFGFILNPARQRWNQFVGAISDTDRAHCYSVLKEMDEAGRKQAIKDIMDEPNDTERLQMAMDRGLLPS